MKTLREKKMEIRFRSNENKRNENSEMKRNEKRKYRCRKTCWNMSSFLTRTKETSHNRNWFAFRTLVRFLLFLLFRVANAQCSVKSIIRFSLLSEHFKQFVRSNAIRIVSIRINAFLLFSIFGPLIDLSVIKALFSYSQAFIKWKSTWGNRIVAIWFGGLHLSQVLLLFCSSSSLSFHFSTVDFPIMIFSFDFN